MSEKNLSEERTDLSEDRTVLSNMRTYAGWMRTGMAAMALGLGVQAIFGAYEPTWVARMLATLFVASGILIIYLAYKNARRCQDNLSIHSVKPMSLARIALFSSLLILSGIILIVVLWTI